LADSLVGRLMQRDPLSQRVHHRPVEMLGLALRAALRVAGRRLVGAGAQARRAARAGGRDG
jgi:hypothetical protein